MFQILKYDLHRYFKKDTPFLSKMEKIIFTPGIWAIVVYRGGNWLQANIRLWYLRKLLMIAIRIIHFFICIPIGIDISFNAKIGKGFYIGHYGGIVVNKNAVIGDFCNLSQGVTIGEGGRGDERGTPIIGNKVYIALGAKIFGKIKIGNKVAIGANAVVNKSFSDNSVEGGVPARVLNFNSSFDFISIDE